MHGTHGDKQGLQIATLTSYAPPAARQTRVAHLGGATQAIITATAAKKTAGMDQGGESETRLGTGHIKTPLSYGTEADGYLPPASRMLPAMLQLTIKGGLRNLHGSQKCQTSSVEAVMPCNGQCNGGPTEHQFQVAGSNMRTLYETFAGQASAYSV